ncbi:MAG: hypothetical protein M3O34_00770 [Chloroflexota bacterium]|nr:hypothetical protein [Chloroflexota bacterium]
MHAHDPSSAPRRVPVPEEKAASWDLDLASQVAYFLYDQGETHPVPILGGFVTRAQPDGRVHVHWRLPGPAVFGSSRRRRHLRRYEYLLQGWGMATELHLEGPEPYLACWIAGR